MLHCPLNECEQTKLPTADIYHIRQVVGVIRKVPKSSKVLQLVKFSIQNMELEFYEALWCIKAHVILGTKNLTNED